VKRDGMTFAGLMRESTDCVESALRKDNTIEQMVATRIVETPDSFHRWENEHSSLMRGIADYSALKSQVGALKQTTLSLIHGKALFEHLKKKGVRGEQRTQLIRQFYPNRGYTSAMVAAHGSYLRKTCSFLCTSQVGTDVIKDDEFLDPLQHYENLYAEYFDLYCRLSLPGGEESAAPGHRRHAAPARVHLGFQAARLTPCLARVAVARATPPSTMAADPSNRSVMASLNSNAPPNAAMAGTANCRLAAVMDFSLGSAVYQAA
jgi:hypothetical protein